MIMARDLAKPRLVLWKQSTESDIIYKYLNYDSLFIVFTQKELILLNIKTGIKEWETGIERLVSDPLLVKDDLYFIAERNSNDNIIYAFDLNKRIKKWSKNFTKNNPYYELAVEDRKVCYISSDGIHILDALTGKELYLATGSFDPKVISIIDDHIIVYEENIEPINIGTAIGLNSGKIEYQYFTSDGFPPLGEEDMCDLAKEMKEKGESDWWEGLGYNYLDGTDVSFTKDNSTGLIYANGWGAIYCFEYIE
jgi:hypothetical protein